MKEIHSADRSCWIQKVHDGWGVWWKGWRYFNGGTQEPATYETREDARKCIRALKSTYYGDGVKS